MTVYSVDEAVIRAELEDLVADLATRPEVIAVILFGSLSSGQFGIGSDVDLLVILSDSPLSFLDRVPRYKPERFPVDVDVFPYTLEEIRHGQSLACEALSQGQVMWQRTPVAWFPGPYATGRTGTQTESPECV